MRKVVVLSAILWTMVYGPWTSEANAEVVIKTRAVNPLNTESSIPIKIYLPKGAGPGDVVSVSGERLAVSAENRTPKTEHLIIFDKDKGQYYVEQEIVLGPKEVVVLEVEVRDVWVIEEERIASLRLAVSGVRLAPQTENRKPKTEHRYETALTLQQEILKNLDRITERQAQNTVALVGAQRHMQAYEENVEALKQAEADAGVLRNLVSQ